MHATYQLILSDKWDTCCLLTNRYSDVNETHVTLDEWDMWYLIRERPFNLKGGGCVFFSKKKNSDSQCCWKKYSDFGGGKK